MGGEGAVGVVLELECLGVVAGQHGSTGTHRTNEGTAEPRFSVTTGNFCYQKIHSRMMAKAVGLVKLRQLEKSGGVPEARRAPEAGEKRSLLGVGPGDGVGFVGDRGDHLEQPSPWEFVKNCM